MARRRRPEKRVILPDPKFKDLVLSKFMNNLMLDGKKSVAERIVYGALDSVEAKAKTDPVQLFHDALEQYQARYRSAQPPCWWCDLPGAGRGSPRACPGSGHPLDDLCRTRPE